MTNIEIALSLSSRQHGAFAVYQLKELGIKDGSIHRICANPIFTRSSRGVYTVSNIPETWSMHAMIAVLKAGSDALLSHESALINLKLLNRGFVSLRNRKSVQYHVTLPRESGKRFTSSTHRSIYKEDLFKKTMVNSIPQVPVEIAIIESMRHLPDQFRSSVIDGAILRQLTSAKKLQFCLSQLWPAPGRSKSRVEELVKSYVEDPKNLAKTESVLEARVLRIVSRITNEKIVTQHWVTVGGNRYRVDIAVPSKMLAIEVDGFEFHGSREVFDKDKKRQNDLVAAGWTVLRFTATQSDGEIRHVFSKVLSDGLNSAAF